MGLDACMGLVYCLPAPEYREELISRTCLKTERAPIFAKRGLRDAGDRARQEPSSLRILK
jgi:hypothetical protein